jgi:hypothetical protein
MWIHHRVLLWGPIVLAPLLAVLWVAPVAPVPVSSATAQDKSKSKKSSKGGRGKAPGNTKALDLQADQVQSTFTKEAEELAGKYYDAGYPDKARALLESVLAVNPNAPNIQQKLELVREGVLTSNDFEVEVNPSQGWKATPASVEEKRSIRIKAEGTYRFELGVAGMTAAGFPEKEPADDMIPGIPLGALMGIVIGEGKPGKPFLIGEMLENYAPRENGLLYLRINAPLGNKNSGKIKVTISGNVQASK